MPKLRRTHAFYATNVFHYDHVLEALSAVYEDVTLQRRFELTPVHVEWARRLAGPSASKTLERRLRTEAPKADEIRNLGYSQLLLPLRGRMGTVSSNDIRLVTRLAARAVMKKSRGSQVLQFVEGLGHKALTANEYRHTLCERRNLHHAVFEKELERFGGFPSTERQDPIGEFLDIEYHLADRILVYSDVARRSFIERGFDQEKVLVAPIGMRPVGDYEERPRDEYNFCYVGRGDAYKGLDVAVAAVAALGAPYRLTVAGAISGPVREWLRLQRHVDFVGLLGREELIDLYSRTTGFVAPSVESFGLALMEAAAYGAPIICRETTGAAEFLPETLVRVVIGRDPSRWASALQELVDLDGPTSVERARLGREAVAQLNWKAAASRLEAIYRGL